MLSDVGKFARLEWFFWVLVRGMAGVQRWKTPRHPKHSQENVLQHSFKTFMLTLLAVLLERRAGSQIDGFWLLIKAAGHDLEEAVGLGDQNYYVRRHPRLKALLDKLGEEMIDIFLNEHLPRELAEELRQLLTSDAGHEEEARFFSYLEHIGYITFAIYEVEVRRFRSFYDILDKHIEFLDKGSEEFPDSIGVIWSGIKPTVLDLLAKKPK